MKMPKWSFILSIDGDLNAARINALYEAGCTDAAFIGEESPVTAEFDRDAPSLLNAVSSAIRDVESVPGLKARHVAGEVGYDRRA